MLNLPDCPSALVDITFSLSVVYVLLQTLAKAMLSSSFTDVERSVLCTAFEFFIKF